MKCACGCGEDAPIADRTDRARGRVKGEPLRFVRGHNRRLPRQMPFEKTCSRCRQVKRADAFYADKTKTTGLSAECRECRKRSAAAWHKANPERHAASAREWQAKNKERYKATRQEGNRRRRARLKKVRVEKIDPWAIYKRDGGKCHICGKHVRRDVMSLDHLIPIADGGEHSVVNVRLAHVSCNVRRGTGRRTNTQLLLT